LSEEELRKTGINLPEPSEPIGNYTSLVRSGNLLFVSGMLPRVNGKILFTGKVGGEITIQEGYDAAKLCVLNSLSAVKAEIKNLDKISRVVKVVGYVASEKSFFDQPRVVDGASDILVRIFGNRGKHARVSVGVSELPGNAPVEIEVIFEIRD